MRFKEIWNKVTRSDSFLPARLDIPSAQTDIGHLLENPFRTNEQYFTVRVNEMYLTYQRKWFSEYDPVVFVASEFVYDNEKMTVPFVVGKGMLDGLAGKFPIPDGMIYKNVTVAGTHPFRGDPFTLNIVLGRLRQKDYLRKILKLIESTSATYTGGFATLVKSYAKVASVVLDGIDYLMDSKEIEPLIGHSNTIMQNANDEFRPGYYALINKSEKEIKPSDLFVKKNGLYFGESLENSEPFREDDYVLYSVMSVNERNDTDLLPFKKEWDDLLKYAMSFTSITDDDWLQIKGKLFALHSSVRLSPDLTRAHASKINDGYKKEILDVKKERADLGADRRSLAAKSDKDPYERQMDQRALDILKL
ncbi:MAG: hypothetical protein ABUM51_04530 [Bacteroidota bacterium]